MDSQTYRSLVESYHSVYDNELNEMVDYSPPPKPAAEVRTAKQPESRKPPSASSSSKGDGLSKGMFATLGAISAAAGASRLKKDKASKGKYNMGGGSSPNKYKSKDTTSYASNKAEEDRKAAQRKKDHAMLDKMAAERRAKKDSESKAKSEAASRVKSSLEKAFASSPSSKGGDGSGPGSKEHKKKQDEKKAKQDKYFKDAAAKYNRSGGGNRELNQSDIRKDTGTSMGLGRVKSKEEEDKKKNVKEEYRKQRILESLRRCKLRQYK